MHFLCYSGPKREQRSRLKVTEGGLGTRLGLGLRVETSIYGSLALFTTMLSLVLSTSWDLNLTIIHWGLVDSPLNCISRLPVPVLALLGLLDPLSQVIDSLLPVRCSMEYSGVLGLRYFLGFMVTIGWSDPFGGRSDGNWVVLGLWLARLINRLTLR